jgi:hypothetical protein
MQRVGGSEIQVRIGRHVDSQSFAAADGAQVACLPISHPDQAFMAATILAASWSR